MNFAVWKTQVCVVTQTTGEYASVNTPVEQPASLPVASRFIRDIPNGTTRNEVLEKIGAISTGELCGFQNEWPLEVATAFLSLEGIFETWPGVER
jgi:hypothetical protein